MELHTGKPNTPTKPGKSSRPLELGEEIVDFLSDQNGPTAKVKNPKTVEKANVTSSDIELLRRSFLPDRFKFDVALRALLEMEAKPTPKPAPRQKSPPPSAKKQQHAPAFRGHPESARSSLQRSANQG